jgi:hypothetical protein
MARVMLLCGLVERAEGGSRSSTVACGGREVLAGLPLLWVWFLLGGIATHDTLTPRYRFAHGEAVGSELVAIVGEYDGEPC